MLSFYAGQRFFSSSGEALNDFTISAFNQSDFCGKLRYQYSKQTFCLRLTFSLLFLTLGLPLSLSLSLCLAGSLSLSLSLSLSYSLSPSLYLSLSLSPSVCLSVCLYLSLYLSLSLSHSLCVCLSLSLSLSLSNYDHKFNTFPNKPWLLHVCSRSLLKTLWKKEKLLVTSNFSSSHCIFYPFGELYAIFIKFKIVVCRVFQFGRI